MLGDLIIVDDDDERLTLEASGGFRAEVVPEDSDGAWRTLSTPEELVEFYDPTDVFGDLAEALAEAYPSAAGEGEGDEGDDEDADDEEEADDAELEAELEEDVEADLAGEGDQGNETDGGTPRG
jgi:hypothetical protein